MKKILTKVISIITSAALSASVLFGTPLSEFKGLAAEVSAASTESEVLEAIKKMANGEYGAEYKAGNFWNTKGAECTDHGTKPNSKGIGSYDKKYSLTLSGASVSFKDAVQCCGFAAAAFDKLFGDGISGGSVEATALTYSKSSSLKDFIINNAKIGDLIHIENHYFIYTGYNSTHLFSYDANGWNYGATCRIGYSNEGSYTGNKRPWDNKKLQDGSPCVIWHAKNYTLTIDTESNVKAKIDTLLKYFKDGDNFTDDGKDSCCKSGGYCISGSCTHCKLHRIWDNNPTLKAHPELKIYKPANGNSCNAFAQFVYQYLFGNSARKQVVSKTLTNEMDWSKCKTGDWLKFTGANGSNHNAIFVSYNPSTKKIKIYESNSYNSANGSSAHSNMITYRDVGLTFDGRTNNGSRKYIEVFRSEKMTSTGEIVDPPSGEHYIVDKNYSGSDPKNIRAGRSTGSALLGTIPKNTVCWVTEISGSGSNIWGKVTYNGVTGYINLYYSVTTTEHQWSSWTTTKAATCTESGTETRSCGCGKTEEQTIAATGHSYGSWQTVTAATCTKDGTEQRTCSKCGNKETRSIAATGHTYKDETIAPTCTEGGYTKHTCTVCGDSYTDNKTAATGHSYGSWQTVTAATCTKDGTEQRTCSKCGNKETRSIAATGHTYKDETIAPTCTEGGYTKHTCTKCGDSYTDNNTAALGHQYKEEKVKPTPTSKGYTKHTCTVCGHSYNDNYTPILGDLNNDGKITTVDAKWVLQYVSGSRTLTEEQKAAADVNGDGKITTVDAKWILQAVSGSRVF